MTFFDGPQQGLEKSLEIRQQLGLDFLTPIGIYDACDELGVTVRFVNDISMEGVYVGSGLTRPTIFLSTLRPQARRVFTCAHELGHHVFSDGSVLHELSAGSVFSGPAAIEGRANSFAGHLLMPFLAIARQLTLRDWKAERLAPGQAYILANAFGVGYTTLVRHMQIALHLITKSHADVLARAAIPRIRRQILGFDTNAPLAIADQNYPSRTLDVEVGDLISLPPGVFTEGNSLETSCELLNSFIFRAARVGIQRVTQNTSGWAILVRVSKQRYRGMAIYRHLEEADDDESQPQ